MIFITGINSFVGKYLVSELKKRNLKFIGVDINGKENQYFKKIDIRDKKIEKYITSKTTIIHLASLSTDRMCLNNPDLAFDVNVGGTINLINIANKKKVKRFIFASTEWVYGNQANKIQSENDQIKIENLNSFYAITKAIGEKLILNKNNKFKQIILRFGIIYGERVTGSAVESIFRNCVKNKTVEIGSKYTSRRFIHISDIVQGIIKVLKFKNNNIFNLTGSVDITLQDVVNISSKVLKKIIKIKEINPKIVSNRKPTNNKLKKETDWKPRVKLLQGVKSLKKCYNII